METFSVRTARKEVMIDITAEIRKIIKSSNVTSGICLVFIPHTTAGVTINENADRDVPEDIIRGLAGLEFEKIPFHHAEGNSPAHLKSSLIGCSATVIIEDGVMQLGTWQGVFFCEFDGPRTRQVNVKIIRDH